MNPITKHANLAKSQMPKGSGARFRCRRVFLKPRGHTDQARSFTNLEIVRMRLEDGDKAGARRLLEEIKSGAKKALAVAE